MKLRDIIKNRDWLAEPTPREVETSMDYGVLGDASIDNLIAYGSAADEQDAKEYLGIEEEE